MKNFLFLVFLIPSLYFSQNAKSSLNFSDLVELYQNDYNFASEFLEKKGFSFNKVTEGNSEEGAVWKLSGDYFLFIAKYCFESDCGRINIQTDNAKLYKLLKTQAKNYGFKYDYSEISKELGAIFSSFKFKDFVLTIGEGTKNEEPYYSLSLDKYQD